MPWMSTRPEPSRPRPRPSKIGLETSRDRDRSRDFNIPGECAIGLIVGGVLQKHLLLLLLLVYAQTIGAVVE